MTGGLRAALAPSGAMESAMQIDPMQSVLAQMRSLAAQAAARPEAAAPAGAQASAGAQQTDFADSLKAAVSAVGKQVDEATALQQQFVSGASDVSLSDVMLATQKATLSFQAMVQVRNRLVTAYQDIMNISA